MFNLSGSEIIFLIIIALVVLGPDKLPDAMRKAGKAYGDFKRMTSGFQNEMKSVLDEPMRELRETADLAKKSAMFDTSAMTKPVSGIMTDAKTAAVSSGNMPVRSPAPSEPPAAVPIAAPEAAPVATVPAAAEPVVAESATVDAAAAEPVVAKPTAAAPAPQPASIDDTIASLDATARRLARMAQEADNAPDASRSSTAIDGAPVE